MTAIVAPAYEQVISNQHFYFFTKYYRIASFLLTVTSRNFTCSPYDHSYSILIFGYSYNKFAEVITNLLNKFCTAETYFKGTGFHIHYFCFIF